MAHQCTLPAITNVEPNIKMYKNVRDLNRQGGRSFGAPIIDENKFIHIL